MSGPASYLGQPASASTSFLDIPAIQVPLPDSPYVSQAASPEPMSSVDPSQPAYIHDFTWMLEYMNQNHAQFQEQITRAISLLTGARELAPVSQRSQGNNNVKLRNPQVFNGHHEEVIPFLSEVQ